LALAGRGASEQAFPRGAWEREQTSLGLGQNIYLKSYMNKVFAAGDMRNN
jgi:hypothetical protein